MCVGFFTEMVVEWNVAFEKGCIQIERKIKFVSRGHFFYYEALQQFGKIVKLSDGLALRM